MSPPAVVEEKAAKEPIVPPGPNGCICSETVVRDQGSKPYRLQVAHDCEYVRWRNALIPSAMQTADRLADRKDPKWSEAFLHEMERLAREEAS